MLLIPEVLTLLFLNLLFLFFATIAFITAVRIVWRYDASSLSNEQYILEKKSYLAATVIKFIFYIKIPLFIFFVYTLEQLSTYLPGAMCAAGVVNATTYGTPLLYLKILNLYLFALWLTLHHQDMLYESQPYLKAKFILFIVAYFLLVGEIVLEGMMFFGLDPRSVVDCCGAIFSTASQSYMASLLALPHLYLLSSFYGVFALMVGAYIVKSKYLYSFLNLLYIPLSIVLLIAFFGTYIYEQPSHHCPFCLLQKDYNYIGYFLYTLLFCGTFYGLTLGLISFKKREFTKRLRRSFLCNTLYLLLVSYYPLFYYFKNGVWL